MVEVKTTIYSLKGSKTGEVDLPSVFDIGDREDLVRRVHDMLLTHTKQPQGRDPLAGQKTSARTYNPPTGHGVARVPRVKGSRHPRGGQAAGIASVVKGRQAHPPKSQAIQTKRITSRERRLATSSAIAFTANKSRIGLRGHDTNGILSIPLVVSDDLEAVVKARDLRKIFSSLGLTNDLQRVSRNVQPTSGVSRLRGRTKKIPKGPLIVVGEDKGISKAVGSFFGVDCVTSKDLNLSLLAPGGHPGRLTVWTSSAIISL
ncbi:MAG: 50S ribosomal protein L4, partial [Nitrososphaerales archaeon]